MANLQKLRQQVSDAYEFDVDAHTPLLAALRFILFQLIDHLIEREKSSNTVTFSKREIRQPNPVTFPDSEECP